MDVGQYYTHTRFDYRVMWNLRGGRALHFGFYDASAGKHHLALENMNRVMAGLAQVRPGERVLDAGCGIGSASFWLAKHCQASVTGINIVAHQIMDCQETAIKLKAENVEFIEADFCDIPFPEETFDVVWACESICHAVCKTDFYQEAFRVLKPGGRLVIAEYIRSARPLPEDSERLLMSWIYPWAIPDLDTAAEHRHHALNAGFEDFEFRDVTPNVHVSLRNLHELCSRWLPMGKMLHRLGLVSSVRLNNALASMRQWEALQNECWQYSMMLVRK